MLNVSDIKPELATKSKPKDDSNKYGKAVERRFKYLKS
jgi:hypothetical protein